MQPVTKQTRLPEQRMARTLREGISIVRPQRCISKEAENNSNKVLRYFFPGFVS